ncbi:MAG: DUF433 domain-containing protein [Gemmatimonadota bacterium]|nr:DUF433 domain-containing protein [Gemmatimonadota bacterium]
MDYMTHLNSDPDIMSGECVFTGTRVTLRTIIASLAEGDSVEELLANFPSLKPEDIVAAIAFAADHASRHIPPRGLPAAGPLARS